MFISSIKIPGVEDNYGMMYNPPETEAERTMNELWVARRRQEVRMIAIITINIQYILVYLMMKKMIMMIMMVCYQAFEWKTQQHLALVMDRLALHKSRLEAEALRR